MGEYGALPKHLYYQSEYLPLIWSRNAPVFYPQRRILTWVLIFSRTVGIVIWLFLF